MVLPLAHEILQLAARRVERVRDRHLHILVSSGHGRIPTYGDILCAGNRQTQADAISVTLVMAMLRLGDDRTHRHYVIVKLLELLGLSLAHALLNVVDVCDVLEDDLQRNLHHYTLTSFIE